MDWNFVNKSWDKWAPSNVGSSGQPLKAALLLNYDPTGPSRLLSTMRAELKYLLMRLFSDHGNLRSCILKCEGMKADPIELRQFIDFLNRGKLQMETFFIEQNQFMITSIHENWFSARCMDTSTPAGEGAVIMQTAAFVLVALYDGPIGAASRAVVAADQLVWQFSRRNL